LFKEDRKSDFEGQGAEKPKLTKRLERDNPEPGEWTATKE